LAAASFLVKFHASVMRQLLWHLFTGRVQARILKPPSLRRTLVREFELALARNARRNTPRRR